MGYDLKSEFRAIARANLQGFNKENARFSDKKINVLLKKIIKNELDSSAIRANPKNAICKICANLNAKIHANPNAIRPKKPKNILLYAPLNAEVNIFPLIFYLKKQKNIKIFLPFVFQSGKDANRAFKIVPFRLPLTKNKFNIFEAKNSSFLHFGKIDLAIVPILGADCDFCRIGFGKGMYDRFYAGLKNKPKTIFVSRILCFSNAKISDFYDIKGDILVATKGKKYEFYHHWTNRGEFCRPSVFYHKAILHQRARFSHRASANQS